MVKLDFFLQVLQFWGPPRKQSLALWAAMERWVLGGARGAGRQDGSEVLSFRTALPAD